jgi:hypothetical protein
MWQLKVYSDQGSIVGRYDFQPPYYRMGNTLILANTEFHILIEKNCKLKFMELQDEYGLIMSRVPILIGEENKLQDNTIYMQSIERGAGNTISFPKFTFSPIITYNLPTDSKGEKSD